MSKPTWKVLLDQGRSLIKSGYDGGKLYDAIRLFQELEKLPGFVADCTKRSVTPSIALTAEFPATFNDWTALCSLITRFPKRADWVTGDLRLMQLKQRQLENAERKEAEKKAGKGLKVVRHNVTRKEYSDLEEKYRIVTAENEQLKARINTLERALSVLERKAN